MPQYVIYFDQQWVGDHDEAWFESRVEPFTAVVRDMQNQSVLVHAGGLVEKLEEAASADATSGELIFTDGPYAETKEWLGGLTIVDVPDDESARKWAGRVARGAPGRWRCAASRPARCRRSCSGDEALADAVRHRHASH